MSNTITSPNMSMPVPVVSVDPGPDWANDINACLSIVDSHNHSSGQGVQITPSGININANMPFNGNNATTLRSARFSPQSVPLAGVSDLGCLYESGVDLYYNDGAGNQIRVTQSGSVSGASGTITGLPSGTAGASFSGGTFTFISATSTPATMAVGPLVVGAAVANAKTVTISPPVGLAANYALTLPSALPASTSFLDVDASGNMASVATTGSGNVVLATSPTITTPVISGVPTGTVTAAVFTPTITQNLVSGSALTFTVNSSKFYYTRIGNIVTVFGSINYTTSGFTGASSYAWQSTIPIATTTLVPSGTYIDIKNSLQTCLINVSNTAVVSAGLNAAQSGPSYTGNQNIISAFSYAYEIN